MRLLKCLLTANDCCKSGRTIKPKGVMVHSTGVAQPDPDVFLRRWNKPEVEKCVHAFAARDRVIQTLPWTTRGWHAGTGQKGSANNTHISFECCEPAGHTYQGGTMVGYDVQANTDYFHGLYQNAVALTALLCREGLLPFAVSVTASRRLRRAARLGAALCCAGSALGLLLCAYLTSVGAYTSLSPLHLLIYMFTWLAPVWFLSGWAHQF